MAAVFSMYRAGLEAATRYIVDDDPGYICPLCLTIVREPNDLSREHVPPRAMGGKVLCLLCKNCNSRAGHSVDAAMTERIAAAKVLSTGTTRKFLELRLDELSIRAALRRDGTHGELQIAERHNNPANVDALRARIRKPRAGTGIQVWYPHQFNDHYAMVGYLKTAYLYAFAKFGYAYILRACMDLVRKQILTPGTKVIWKWWLARKEDCDESKLYLCDAPINCLAVGLGEHIIVLPSLREPHDQYDRLRALTEGTSPDHLVGEFQVRSSLSVPTGMEMLCETMLPQSIR